MPLKCCAGIFSEIGLATLNTEPMAVWILILATAYLLGSIPFGYLLVRIFRKADIRSTGSGNIGATNVARSGAKGLGILTLALDLCKGLAAVLLARHFAPGAPGLPSDLAMGAAVAAVLGHVFPVWLGFRGGKGVATALGVFFGIGPLVALAALAVFVVTLVFTRLVSLASIIAAVLVPVFALLLMPDRSPLFVGGFIFIALVVVLKHHSNIARLKQGTEHKLGEKKVAA